MTKQCILNEINQLNRYIRDCDNRINSIYGYIREEKSMINALEEEKRKLFKIIKEKENDWNQISRLQSKMNKKRTEFASKQRKRLQALRKRMNIFPHVCFIHSYLEGMQDLLSGSEYKKIMDEFDRSDQDMSQMIRKIQNQIEVTRSEISSLNYKMKAYEEQIRRYSDRIENERSCIWNYKRRIDRLRKELKYAT